MGASNKKTKVISLRIPLEDLQSCFDLCEKAKHPTSIASSAISRSLSVLLSSLRVSKVLPSYTSEELLNLCASYKEKINPASMPSLELSSICTSSEDQIRPPSSTLQNAENIAESGASLNCGASISYLDQSPESEASSSFDVLLSCVTPPKIVEKKTFEEISRDKEELEDEILRQMKEIELEDEVDLLSRILIS